MSQQVGLDPAQLLMERIRDMAQLQRDVIKKLEDLKEEVQGHESKCNTDKLKIDDRIEDLEKALGDYIEAQRALDARRTKYLLWAGGVLLLLLAAGLGPDLLAVLQKAFTKGLLN